MQIENWKVERIVPYEKNPRRNNGAVDAVAASINEFGFQQPLVVDKDGVLIVGHTRLKAAKKLGLKEVPVVVADGLSPEQAKAYRLADNKTSDFSQWDNALLLRELEEIAQFDADLFTGFSKFDFPEDEMVDGYEVGREDGIENKLSQDDAVAMYEVTFRSEDAEKIDRIQAMWEGIADG